MHLKTTYFFNMGGGQHTTPANPGLPISRTTHNSGHTMHHVDPTIDE